MTRTPDEIKKGLMCCYEGIDCTQCPYVERCFEDDEKPYGLVVFDAIALIQQLEAERDAAVRDLKALCGCMACDHAEKDTDSAPCSECTNCNGAVVESKWQWRGVTKEE